MTSQDRAIELTKFNVHGIFGEKVSVKRQQALSLSWASGVEVLYVDPTGVYKTHDAINSEVEGIHKRAGADSAFVELSDVECLKHDEEGDIWVTKLKWGFGPKGVSPAMTGLDIVTIVEGKITACYAFLNPE